MANLRKEFEAILKENEAMPEKERLPRDAFHIDPGLKESIEAETEARLEETKAELAWASEKAALGLQKMEETFLASSAVEAMELKALGDAQLKVSSFRTTELADWQKEAMEQVHELIEAEQARGAWGKQASGAADYSAEEAGGEEDESGLPGAAALMDDNEPKLSKAEERIARRQARAKQWTEFNARKPDERYEATRLGRRAAHAHRPIRPIHSSHLPLLPPTGTRTPPTSRRSRTRGSTWETSR